MAAKDAKETSRKQIIQTAAEKATLHGLAQLRYNHIVDSLGKSQGVMHYHFGNMVNIRAAVVEYAVEHAIYPILADYLTQRDREPLTWPEGLRQGTLDYILTLK